MVHILRLAAMYEGLALASRADAIECLELGCRWLNQGETDMGNKAIAVAVSLQREADTFHKRAANCLKNLS